MNKIVGIIFICGAVILHYNSRASLEQASIYKVEYSGEPGTKVLGIYTLVDSQGLKPSRLKKIEATLPHQLSITVPADYQVIAGAVLFNGDKESVTTTIFKDGVECSYPSLMGAEKMNLMTCEP